MAFIMRNEEFQCEFCGATVTKHPEWSARNHCPKCLCSKHVDKDFPGDRASECGARMDCIRFENRKNKWMVAIHHCSGCGKEISNLLSSDDDVVSHMRLLAKLHDQRLSHP